MFSNSKIHSQVSRRTFGVRADGLSFRLATAALAGTFAIAITALSLALSGSAALAAPKNGNGGGGDKTTLGGLSCDASNPFARYDGAAWVCDVGTEGSVGPKGDAGIGDIGCEVDQIAKWDGTQWVCADVAFLAPKTVFVTSETFYSADLKTLGGAATGLAGGDALCQAAADSSAAVPPGTYTAWLSTDTVDAIDRLAANPLGYFLPSGAKVWNSTADITSGPMLHAIDRDEFTDTPTSNFNVWTGTRSDGAVAMAGISLLTCYNWTSGSPISHGLAGDLRLSDSGWTDAGSGASSYCDAVYRRLYCIQQ